MGLFLFVGVGFADGNIGGTPFFLETAAEVIAATGGTGDRQERAIIRRMEYEEHHGPEIEAKWKELRYIDNSIDAVADPMERMVLRIRYTGSETAKPKPWREIAIAIYKDNSDSRMLATYRLLDKALKSFQNLMG